MEILDIITEKINNNQFEDAYKLINENSSKLETNSEFWNIKGVLLIHIGFNKDAIDCFRKAISLNDANLDALHNLVDALELDIQMKQQDELYSGNNDAVIVNTNNMQAPAEGNNIFDSRENVSTAFYGEGVPIVSIFVMAYNRLEKTKICVDCILKYTAGIDYELILIDNGSSDGTIEYFKSVIFTKKRIIKVTKNIGLGYGWDVGVKYCRGKYFVCVPNDVYVTPRWLSNMLKCAESDERIGMVCPISSNVSNLQGTDISFNNLNEMQKKAAEHNISDPRKWHERLRLITVLGMYKRECMDMVGKTDYGFFHDFMDDDYTFRIRHAGYKAILCRDTFVHHDHNVFVSEDKNPKQFQQSLEKGRENFREKYYGVDAWEDVNNFEPTIMALIDTKKKSSYSRIEILGIDVLCGTPILELKNKLRDAGVFDVQLSAFTSGAKYWLDLNTICQGQVICDRQEYLLKHFDKGLFDYVVLGKPINLYQDYLRLLCDILHLVKDHGHLMLKLRNSYDVQTYLNTMGNKAVTDSDMPAHISIDTLIAKINTFGFKVKSMAAEVHKVDDNTKMHIRESLAGSELVKEIDATLDRLLICNYVLDVVKTIS